jgi:transposase
MRRFVDVADRGQWTLLPECLDDFIDESNPVRVIDAFVEALDLAEMSFEGVERRQLVGRRTIPRFS